MGTKKLLHFKDKAGDQEGYACPHCKKELTELTLKREWIIDLKSRKINTEKSPYIDHHTKEGLFCPECGGELDLQ